MFYFIDLCCGFGAMTKAFEKTGAFKNILAADIDDNMRNHFAYLFKKTKPLKDITDEKVNKIIGETAYDVLTAGISHLNENIFFAILEIIERDLPKAFVLEMSMNTIDYSFCKMLNNFCEKNGYLFIGYDEGIDNLKLNLENFGIPEYCERIYCVCIKKEWARCDDKLFLQLNKKHDFKCYQYEKYDPEKKPEQRRGIDWGFHNFKFLEGTTQKDKEKIIENSTPIPVAASVALDLNGMLKW